MSSSNLSREVPPRPLRVGIIGAGNNARKHAAKTAADARTTLVAIADPVEEIGRPAAAELEATWVPDYERFLSDVDVVVVSSPNFLHKEHAVACARAGKHVYCEKPMGLSYPEAEEIATAVREAGVRCAIGFSVSSGNIVQTLLHYQQQGHLGTPVQICSERRVHALHPAGHWRLDADRSGGVLLEINVHEIEWMMRLGGEVESVYARFQATDTRSPRANDHFTATLNFAAGGCGVHLGSWQSRYPSFRKLAEFSEMTLASDMWSRELYRYTEIADPEAVPMLPALDVWNDFLTGILEDQPLFNDVEWGLKVMATAEAIYRSAKENRVVPLHEILGSGKTP